MLDFTTVYNKEDYYQAIGGLGIHICDCQNIVIPNRDCANLYLHQILPFDLLNLGFPILYFVDTFISLFDNNLWFQNRDVSRDIVIDRHGNVYALSEIKNKVC